MTNKCLPEHKLLNREEARLCMLCFPVHHAALDAELKRSNLVHASAWLQYTMLLGVQQQHE